MRKTPVIIALLLILASSCVFAAPLAVSGGTITARVGNTTTPPVHHSGGGGGGGGYHTQCDDHRDNDGDGLVDLKDPGCTTRLDNAENLDELIANLSKTAIQDVENISPENSMIAGDNTTLMELLEDFVSFHTSEEPSPGFIDSLVQRIKLFYRRVLA